MRLSRRLLLPLVLLALSSFAQAATLSPYRVEIERDGPLAALSGAVWFGPKLLVHGIGRAPCPCDASGLNPLDRWVAGKNDEHLSRVSGFTEMAFVTAALVADAAEKGQTGHEFLKDAAVMIESAEVDRALGEVVKILAHRPRPYLYGMSAGDSLMRDPKSYRSFYSGHTAVVWSVGMSYARTYALRHPQSPDRWKIYGAVGLAGLTEAGLRVLAGRHYPTDVLAAAVAGSLSAFAVTEWHRRDLDKSNRPATGPGPISFSIRIPLR